MNLSEIPCVGLDQYHYEESACTETIIFYAEGRAPFKVRCNPESIYNGTIWSHLAEIDIRSRFWRGFTERDCVLDAGHGFGAYTFPPAALGAEVWAIDPEGLDGDYRGFWLSCVANDFFEGRLHVAQRFLGSKWKPPGRGQNSTGVCETWTIDKFDRPFTFINLDTEGAELDILHGAVRTIEQHKPRILLENHLFIDPDCEKKHDEFLLSRGYKKLASLVEGACTHSFYVHPEGR